MHTHTLTHTHEHGARTHRSTHTQGAIFETTLQAAGNRIARRNMALRVAHSVRSALDSRRHAMQTSCPALRLAAALRAASGTRAVPREQAQRRATLVRLVRAPRRRKRYLLQHTLGPSA